MFVLDAGMLVKKGGIQGILMLPKDIGAARGALSYPRPGEIRGLEQNPKI